MAKKRSGKRTKGLKRAPRGATVSAATVAAVDYSALRDRLRTERLRRQLTYDVFAAELDWSLSGLQKFLNGGSQKPQELTLARVLHRLDTSEAKPAPAK